MQMQMHRRCTALIFRRCTGALQCGPAALPAKCWADRGGGIAGFGTAAKQVAKLRVKGVAARALRKAPPPQLPKPALQHYVKTLQAHGGEVAKKVVDEADAARLNKEPNALTSEEKSLLLARYLPEEQEALAKLRKHGHKWLWRWIRRRDWKRFQAGLEELKQRGVPFDEVTYNLSLFGTLINKRADDAEAREVLEEMAQDIRFHPALLRMQQGFLDSYFDLCEVDAAPSIENLRKVAKTFWQISVNFKRIRVKEFRRRLADAALQQRRRKALLGQASSPLEQLEAGGADVADDFGGGDADSEMSDGEEYGPGVRMPAKRYPRHLRGAHKGSGVPRQSAFRWKQ